MSRATLITRWVGVVLGLKSVVLGYKSERSLLQERASLATRARVLGYKSARQLLQERVPAPKMRRTRMLLQYLKENEDEGHNFKGFRPITKR